MNPAVQVSPSRVEARRLLLSQAILLGGLAGSLETYLVLETGIVRPAVLVFNFALLVVAFGGAALAWNLASARLPLKRFTGDMALLAAAVFTFALRGCLRDCGSDWLLRVVIPMGILGGGLGLLLFPRRSGAAPSPGRSVLVSTIAMTLSALHLAVRDDLLRGTPEGLPALIGMTVLGGLSALALRGGKGVTLGWLLILGVGSFSWAAQRTAPLGIEPARTRGAGVVGEPRFPNVIVVILDTVRADHLSLYGYARRTSPNLDALARESLVFDHAVASGNYSLPSHASLFTGLLPSQHGAHKLFSHPVLPAMNRLGDSALATGIETLASQLQGRGFTTGGASANYAYLARWTGLQQGFDVFDGRAHTQMGYHPFSFPLNRRYEMFRRRIGRPVRLSQSLREWDGDAVTAAGRHFAATARAPYFLFLNYLDAHDPYRSRAGYRFRGDGLASDRGALPAYDSEIAYVDAEVGRFVAALRESGTLDRTILVVASDHGEFFGEHGLLNHRVGAYEEILHVPLLVRYPKTLAPGRVERAFGLHEVHRLILDLLESRPTDWLTEDPDEPRVLAQVWGQVSATDTVSGDLASEPDANIVYAGSFKLIERRVGQSELYDLSVDPRESRNLLAEPTEAVLALQARMRQAVAKLPPAVKGTRPDATSADLEALRGLGYISFKKPEDL